MPPHRPHVAYEDAPGEQPTRGRRAMRHAGRGFKWAILAVLPFIVLLLLGAALSYVRLRHGPISLAFLAGPIERSINAELVGYNARIGDAIVRLTENGRLEFRLAQVSFQEQDGDTVASAPLAALELSHRALLQGRFAPSRVELIEPRLFLSYSPRAGLSLSFSAPVAVPAPRPARPPGATEEQGANSPQPPALPTAREGAAAVAPADGDAQLKRLDAAALLRRMSAETRSGTTTSFLREFGLRDASVLIDHDGAESLWHVPEFTLDLDHRGATTVISGQARVASDHGGWRMAFHTEDADGKVALHASIRDLVPSAFASGKGPLPLLSRLDLPVGADVSMAIAADGSVAGGDIVLALGKGRIELSSLQHRRHPIDLEAALIKASYNASTNTIDIEPSTLRSAGTSLTLAGTAGKAQRAGEELWAFDIRSLEGTLSAPENGAGPIAVEALRATGSWTPSRDVVVLDGLDIRGGGTSIRLAGEFSTAAARPGVRVEAAMQAAEIATVKSAWPPFLAPLSRQWVARNVEAGGIRSLTWRLASGVYVEPGKPVSPGSDEASSLVIEAGPSQFRADRSLPPIKAPRALIQVENDALEVSVPEAAMLLPSGKQIALKTIRLTSPDVRPEPSAGTLAFRAQAEAAQAIELLSSPGLAFIRPLDNERLKLQGKVETQLTLNFPLARDLDRSQIAYTGTARLTDGKAQKVLGGYDVQGASVSVDLSNGAVEAKGDALVAGVPMRIGWHRILDATGDQQQPPLRINATLDNADRTQLGLDVNHMLHGEIPVDVQILPGEGDPKVHLRADLSSAELILDAISWTKPPGRSAFAEFDIVPVAGNKHELQGFRVAGDNIAIEGTASLGSDGKLREFSFPVFSLNLVTRLAVKGTRGGNGIWNIKANGPTFDGKDFFRALFSVGRVSEHQDSGESRSGLDLETDIDTVLGFSDVSLRGLKLSLSRRGGRLSAGGARGSLDGGPPLAVVPDKDKAGRRRLRADSTDAGQAFKLTGFYPNVQKGRVRLEVNVDGAGAAEKTGLLMVDDFRVLGDPVVAEVVSSIDEGRPPISGSPGARPGKRVVRQVFEFDTMHVPFSVGHGQFVMQDAFVRGPLLGASIRGKVDYKTERMSLGGTYIPLQGLNNAFGQIPLLGQILSGPRGEGIFGITFAIQGAMASPDVIVNPLSLVAPGFSREVSKMPPSPPGVPPRRMGTSPGPPRSWGPPPMTGDDEPSAPGTTIDGWSSETKRP